MKTVTKKRIQINVPIEVQFRAVPTRWAVREELSSGERVFIPEVNQHVERKMFRANDPEEIRKKFFKMEINEQSAAEFLNEVGVWAATIKKPAINNPKILKGMRLFGAFGHRLLDGWATPETVDSLRQEQKFWRELRRHRAKLRAYFAPLSDESATPHGGFMFALERAFGNTLPIHLEWQGRHPRAAIQPVTGREALAALAWVDLVSGAECKICQNLNCGIEYTYGGSKFCSVQCERANTMRTYRMSLKEKARF
jgi:hypothetical protein